jgi:hypothetical protein
LNSKVAHGKLCRQTFSTKSGIFWIYGDLWIYEFPTSNSEVDDHLKCIFQVRAIFFSDVLNLLKSEISQFWVSSGFEHRSHADWQHGQCIQPFQAHGVSCECSSFYILKKRPLNQDLDHTPSPLNSRLVISLQCLQLASDSFQTTYFWICDFQLVVWCLCDTCHI